MYASGRAALGRPPRATSLSPHRQPRQDTHRSAARGGPADNALCPCRANDGQQAGASEAPQRWQRAGRLGAGGPASSGVRSPQPFGLRPHCEGKPTNSGEANGRCSYSCAVGVDCGADLVGCCCLVRGHRPYTSVWRRCSLNVGRLDHREPDVPSMGCQEVVSWPPRRQQRERHAVTLAGARRFPAPGGPQVHPARRRQTAGRHRGRRVFPSL